MLHRQHHQHPHELTLKLQQVCDGLTIEQLKIREKQQDKLIRSARERTLTPVSSRDGWTQDKARERRFTPKGSRNGWTSSNNKVVNYEITSSVSDIRNDGARVLSPGYRNVASAQSVKSTIGDSISHNNSR